jgi:FkbM family methyltransferase
LSAIVLQDYTDDKVYSFEPTNKYYDYLRQTIDLNHSNKIIPIKKALGSKEEQTEIYLQGSASSINRKIHTNCLTEIIETTTLDKFVSENKINVGLIKVDIEGFEQEFLKGAYETIKSQKPTLLISIYHNASDFFDIKPMIESWDLGYKFRIIKPVDGGIRGETLLIAEQE